MNTLLIIFACMTCLVLGLRLGYKLYELRNIPKSYKKIADLFLKVAAKEIEPEKAIKEIRKEFGFEE